MFQILKNRWNLRRLIACLILIVSCPLQAQNPWNGKVVLQGFWWDYHNDNFPNAWADYLTELAPRLREIGIDAVWTPPPSKGIGGTFDVGYGVYDHYDLGDKRQKNTTATRFGNKDQLLRMVAVLHANGLDAIFDIVLNHSIGAQSLDPTAPGDQWKNFRYASFTTPQLDGADVTALQGRWPKNHQNFHPNPDHNQSDDDWTQQLFGPDNCYFSNAVGQSSNAVFNPPQAADWMRNNARAWLIWLKKQTGFDGVRLDAIKHIPHWAAEDFLYNLQHGADWASGGDEMFAVGEFVGGKGQLDQWADDVQNRAGTFDFSLRSALRDMVYGLGNYDLAQIPGAQQNNRLRTVPFVNNHDTFRPMLDDDGNYNGWNEGSELGGGHIEPNEPRLSAAYAVAFAVDGSPQVFFEDLYEVGYAGNRFSHLPTDDKALPMRDDIANIIWAHQKLAFKSGEYRVRHQSGDHLVIERSRRAIIGVNDNWDTWQNATVATDFAPGTQLHDYSGANADDIFVDSDGNVQIWTPPCDGSNKRRGYTIWGPAGIDGGFNPPQRQTVQEWEMADDLGDSHPLSLGQGGALPALGGVSRLTGEIFPETGTPLTIELFPSKTDVFLFLHLRDENDSLVADVSGLGNLTLNYTPQKEGFFAISAGNGDASPPSQTVWIKATYTASKVVDTRGDSPVKVVENESRLPKSFNVSVQPNPFNPSTAVRVSLEKAAEIEISVFDLQGRRVRRLLERKLQSGEHEIPFNAQNLPSGVYFIRVRADNLSKVSKALLLK